MAWVDFVSLQCKNDEAPGCARWPKCLILTGKSMRHPDLEKLVESAPLWPYEAYEFVLNSLDLAARRAPETPVLDDSDTEGVTETLESQKGCAHVSGREICLAARELAQGEFGQMAPIVFREWGIHSTLDLGRIIFKLIEVGLLNQNEEDRVEDFSEIFSVPGELLDGFEIRLPTDC